MSFKVMALLAWVPANLKLVSGGRLVHKRLCLVCDWFKGMVPAEERLRLNGVWYQIPTLPVHVIRSPDLQRRGSGQGAWYKKSASKLARGSGSREPGCCPERVLPQQVMTTLERPGTDGSGRRQDVEVERGLGEGESAGGVDGAVHSPSWDVTGPPFARRQMRSKVSVVAGRDTCGWGGSRAARNCVEGDRRRELADGERKRKRLRGRHP